MTAVIFGSYMAPPAPSIHGLTVTWTGCDGSEWNLTDYEAGRLAITRDGITGLLWPDFAPQVTTSPAMTGQRLTGMSIGPRYVDFPLYLKAADSDDFLDLFTRFTRSWSPTKTGTLSVTSGTTTRSIQLRLNPESNGRLSTDPVYSARLPMSVSAVADDPLWLSEWIYGDWGNGDVQDFLSDAPGYLFWISPSQTFDSATIGNPGDVEAWPVWQVTATSGALSGSMTVDGGTIGIPTIAAGKTIIIDTDPTRGYADLGHMSGEDFVFESEADGSLNPYDARPIPAAAEVPVTFSLTGPGQVSVRFRSRYWLGIGNG